MDTKRIICRVFGHDPTPVIKLTHADGTVVFQSHPNGNRTACRRCKTVRRSTS